MNQRSHSHPGRTLRSVVAGTVALALGLAAVPSVAWAGPSVQEQVDALNSEAVEKFQAKEYDEAVELFEQAYALQPEPNYLFNIGRIREEQGNLESAVEYYERFVKEPGVPLEAREKGLERLRVAHAAFETAELRQVLPSERFTTSAPESTAQVIPAATSMFQPEPVSPSTRTGMMVAIGATPAMPRPLPALAAAIPATWVP